MQMKIHTHQSFTRRELFPELIWPLLNWIHKYIQVEVSRGFEPTRNKELGGLQAWKFHHLMTWHILFLLALCSLILHRFS